MVKKRYKKKTTQDKIRKKDREKTERGEREREMTDPALLI